MEPSQALHIVKVLSEGIDPHTGEVFPMDSPYQHPDTVRALIEAVKALETLKKKNKRQKSSPENAGKSWTKEEDGLLSQRFDAGMKLKQLALIHKRTEWSIKARLVRLGKVEF